MFEWPKFDVKHQGAFEEFAQQVNNAVGYTLSEVTLRGLSETDDSVDPQRFSKSAQLEDCLWDVGLIGLIGLIR